MRYSALIYADAFLKSVKNAPISSVAAMVQRFIRVVEKNGDAPHLSRIADVIEKKMIRQNGGKTVTLEFARPLERTLVDTLRANFDEKDQITVVTNPELIAGVRVTINEEEELDHSMARTLKTMFAPLTTK